MLWNPCAQCHCKINRILQQQWLNCTVNKKRTAGRNSCWVTSSACANSGLAVAPKLPVKDQVNLFDEAKLGALLADLNRIEKISDLPEDEMQSMGDGWVLIGYKASEQLAVIPRQYYVIITKRVKYAPAHDPDRYIKNTYMFRFID